MDIRGIPVKIVPGPSGQTKVRLPAHHGIKNQNTAAHSPRFGDISSTLFNYLPPAREIKIGNTSLEDLAGRLQVLTVYIPQCAQSIYYQNRPYETFGRNALAWLGTFALIYVAKDNASPLNKMFDSFLRPQVALQKPPKGLAKQAKFFLRKPSRMWEYFSNQFRPKENYLSLLKESGYSLSSLKIKLKGNDVQKQLDELVTKKPYWTSFDVNAHDMYNKLIRKLKDPKKIKQIESISHKISFAKLSVAMTTAMIMTYFIGILLQKLVFKYISPLDKASEQRQEKRLAEESAGKKSTAAATMRGKRP